MQKHCKSQLSFTNACQASGKLWRMAVFTGIPLEIIATKHEKLEAASDDCEQPEDSG